MSEDPLSDLSLTEETPSITNVSGGVAVHSDATTIGRDVVGRDRFETTNIYLTSDAAFDLGFAASAVVGKGLLALRELMQRSSQVRTALISFQADFRDASVQVVQLGTYKDLHDLLHRLQFNCFNGLQQVALRFPADEIALDELDQYEQNMVEIVDVLRQVLTRSWVPREEAGWVEDIALSCVELRQVGETQDAQLLKKACWRLRRLLTLQPPRINALLNRVAHELRFHELSLALAAVSDQLATMDIEPDRMSRFRLGVEALGGLDKGLMTLVETHHHWQAIENELRRLDSSIDKDLVELQMSWEDVKSRAEQLCSNSIEDWAVRLCGEGVSLQTALSSNAPLKVKRCFRSYYTQASRRFFMIDLQLKSLCDEMRQIGEPLAAVMEMMA
jgi:hypothetical protein